MSAAPKRRKPLLVALIILPLVCLALIAASFLTSRSLPTRSSETNRLSEVDKAHLLEAGHLRATLGDSIFPGWGSADIAMILYNEQNAFLVGVSQPATGWIKVPDTRQRGADWQPLPGELVGETPYFFQPVADPGAQIGAFTVRVGEHWAASLNTYEWMRIGLVEQTRSELPPFLKDIFPLRFVPYGLFTSDWHILGMMHECFHAYQGILNPEKLDAAENIQRTTGKDYPFEDDRLNEGVKAEAAALTAAVKAESLEEKKTQARLFLDQRARRRATLTSEQIDYERKREWLEGQAKYAELKLWQAADSGGYQPSSDAFADPGFKDYGTFRSQWNDSLTRLSKMESITSDGRFYLSGFAQALLLDDLLPDWKARVMQDGVWLEDLLEESLADK